MSTPGPSNIQQRIAEVEISYQRQLALAGTDRFDSTLTTILRKDLEWLRDQMRELSEIKVDPYITRNS